VQGPHSFPGQLFTALRALHLTINSSASLPWCSLSCFFLVLPPKDTQQIFLLATALYVFEDLHIARSPLSPLGFLRLSFFRPLWQVTFWRSSSLFSSRLFPNCSLQIQTSCYTSGPPCLILCVFQTGTGFISLNLLLFCNSNTLGHSRKALRNEEDNLPVANTEATPEDVPEQLSS